MARFRLTADLAYRRPVVSLVESTSVTENAREPRIGILVVAYNAVDHARERARPHPRRTSGSGSPRSSSATTPARTPPTWSALGYQQTVPDLPLDVIRHEQNLGYGGNQKAGYRLAIEHDLDIVVLLHGDGQYAPELLPDIVAPLVRGEADAVFGSRMMAEGGARAAACRSTSTSATGSSPRFENAVARRRPDRVALRLPRLLASRRCRVDPVRRQLRRLRLRHPDHHPAASTRASASSRSRSRRTTATRSATSTGSATPRDVVPRRRALPPRQDGLRPRRPGQRRRASTASRRARAARTAGSCELLDGLPPSKVLDLGCSSGLLADLAPQARATT